MKGSAYIVIIYAAWVLIGGIIGYLKAQSSASLIMGTLFACGLLIGGVLLLKGNVIGQYIAIGLAAILTAFFSYRFSLNYAFMPAGLMAITSLLATLALLFRK